MVRWSQR